MPASTARGQASDGKPAAFTVEQRLHLRKVLLALAALDVLRLPPAALLGLADAARAHRLRHLRK
jgi:hypothetical protein